MAEWVAMTTFIDKGTGRFYEAGGIYDHQPHCRNFFPDSAREFVPGEPTVACPRCGQRFAATDEDTAEGWRDLHFDGDEIPSICRDFPTQRPRLVVKGGEE